MRIRLTAEPTGIYGAKGQFPTGTELDVKDVPAGWAGRYIVVGEDPKEGSVALTGKNKAQLLEIAKAEGVEVEDDATNNDIKSAIELAREEAAKA
ncbi:hypothetical protein [Croceibacterium aestuarii]|uniref:hypothetical protein n=1 Tax=Croceibacterium aestuarii TaxID=3064139 RepID=UPI00272DF7EC|nr:hypothetical protein [Croceibacterium sp. D39]